MLKLIRVLIDHYRDWRTQRYPSNLRVIDGKICAWCYTRKMWREVKFKGSSK